MDALLAGMPLPSSNRLPPFPSSRHMPESCSPPAPKVPVLVQTAVHTVACLEAHLQREMSATRWSSLEDPDAPDPKDVLELMRMHAHFAGRCISQALLAADAHLCSVVANLLEACLRTAAATNDRILPGLVAPQGVVSRRAEAQARLTARMTDPQVWTRLDSVQKDMLQRVPYLKARLEYRAAMGAFEEWYTTMAFS